MTIATERLRPRPSGTPSRALVRATAKSLLWVGLLGAVWGWGSHSPILLSVATGLLALAYLLFDLTRQHQVSVSVMTFFAFAATVRAFANARGFMATKTAERGEYFIYAVDEHLILAAQLTLAGALLPMLSYWLVRRAPTFDAVFRLFPRVRGAVPQSVLVPAGTLAVALVFASHALIRLPAWGTVTALVYMIPTFMIFVFARIGGARRSPRIVALALLIAFVEAVRAMLFDYLRTGVLVPFVAFVAGFVIGQRSLRFLRSGWAVPVYVSLILFVTAFDELGRVRGQGGVERARALVEEEALAVESPAVAQSFLSRLTTFNQLSRIGWIVEQDGFLRGQTLDYFGYAFIPRFFWPEKPLIAKGSWFAVRIGQAYIMPDGRANNAVNMTVAGELYLNYAWVGVIVGGLLMGCVLAFFWSRAGSLMDHNNVLGWSFAFYLLWLGLSLEQDLQFLVTLTAIYLVFVALSYAARQAGVTDSPARRGTAGTSRSLASGEAT